MEIMKVMVKEGDIATITCPHCKKMKQASVSDYRTAGKRELKIRCSCDEMFTVSLECRQHYRKTTKLLGKSINLSNHLEQRDILIKNISTSGIGFCPFKKHKTRKDDRLQIIFNLNDAHYTPINAEVTVQNTSDEYIGCKFNSTEKFSKPLGFYLIS